jgi:hypothetical protein
MFRQADLAACGAGQFYIDDQIEKKDYQFPLKFCIMFLIPQSPASWMPASAAAICSDGGSVVWRSLSQAKGQLHISPFYSLS